MWSYSIAFDSNSCRPPCSEREINVWFAVCQKRHAILSRRITSNPFLLHAVDEPQVPKRTNAGIDNVGPRNSDCEHSHPGKYAVSARVETADGKINRGWESPRPGLERWSIGAIGGPVIQGVLTRCFKWPRKRRGRREAKEE